MAEQPTEAAQTVGTWEAIKAVLIALPKILDFIKTLLDGVREHGIQEWNNKLDEATRIGVDAGKKGLSVEEAIKLSQRWRDITGSTPRQP